MEYKEAELRNEKELKEILDPLVKEWFFSKFKEFSLPQLYGVMPIYERRNILISAPTGGTKTLTAFSSFFRSVFLIPFRYSSKASSIKIFHITFINSFKF